MKSTYAFSSKKNNEIEYVNNISMYAHSLIPFSLEKEGKFTFVKTWIKLKDILLSKISQTQKNN